MIFKLLKPEEFIQSVISKIDNAEKKVVIISMVLSSDKKTKDLIDSLKRAAERGVEVSLAADYFTFIELGGFIVLNHFRDKTIRKSFSDLNNLRKLGIKMNWLGGTNWFIANGRTHCKWIVADDHVYSFGGVNLYESGLTNCDYMIETKSAELSEMLVNKFNEILLSDKKKFSPKNEHAKIDNCDVMIDGGLVGRSKIYSRACEIAEQSKKITLVSQYPPTGRLSRILKRKLRDGDEVKLYFNNAKTAKSSNKLIIKMGELAGLKTSYNRDKYLHAKFIIFESGSGEKTIISGSHNFTAAGGLFGTREIALETKDKDLINQVDSFLRTEII